MRIVIAACVTIALSAGARADDISRGVMLPELMAEPSGSVHVDRAAILVDSDHITTTFTLRHVGVATVLLLGPRFGWMGEAEPYPDRHFPELHVTLNGHGVPLDGSFAAYVGLADVSQYISEAGLNPFVVTETPPIVDRPAGAGAEAFAHLLTLGAVETMDNNFVARWQVQRAIRLSLGNEPVSTLSLTYRARPGFALMSPNDLNKQLKLSSYCVTRNSLAAKLGKSLFKQALVTQRYNIATGMDGVAPKVVTFQSKLARSVYC